MSAIDVGLGCRRGSALDTGRDVDAACVIGSAREAGLDKDAAAARGFRCCLVGSVRETGRDVADSDSSPRPLRTAATMDFRTCCSAISRWRSALACAGALLNKPTTVDLAVSRTALSASSRHATRLATYGRNRRSCEVCIWTIQLGRAKALDRDELTLKIHVKLASFALGFLPTRAVPKTCFSASIGAAFHKSANAWAAKARTRSL